MPALNGDPKQEKSNCKFEETIRHHIEKLAQIPKLEKIRNVVVHIFQRITHHKCDFCVFVAQIPSVSSSPIDRCDSLER